MATVAEIFNTMEYGPAPESDKEALAWLASHDGKFGHFINGEWSWAKDHFDETKPTDTLRPGYGMNYYPSYFDDGKKLAGAARTSFLGSASATRR